MHRFASTQTWYNKILARVHPHVLSGVGVVQS
jgi:hypothetical protein